MTPPARSAAPRDLGAALILTLFATTLVMIVGTTILSVTVGNLRSARLSQDAAAALDAADAGLAQASAHLRTYGVRGGYGTEASPRTVTVPGGGRYEVWVEPVAPLPAHNPGRYLIHSTGYAGDGVRQIEAEVAIGTRPLGLPLAIFAKTFNGGGSGEVYQESILTTGCVFRRGHITISGTDVAHGIPAAVHSSQYVSTSNGGNSDCGPSNGSIHKNSTCHTSYPHDQSIAGGPFSSGSACATKTSAYPTYYAQRDLDGDGSTDVHGSRIKDEASLRRLFSIPEKPFTDAQLETLRDTARATGTYFTTASFSGGDIPNWSTAQPHLVVFFDLGAAAPNSRLVDLKHLDGWGRPTGAGTCPEQSLVIVIVGGDARLNSNHHMVANLVLTSPAPYGHVSKANGTVDMVGTIYADTVDLTGNAYIELDECFVQNLSPSLVDTTLTMTHYREIDRTG